MSSTFSSCEHMKASIIIKQSFHKYDSLSQSDANSSVLYLSTTLLKKIRTEVLYWGQFGMLLRHFWLLLLLIHCHYSQLSPTFLTLPHIAPSLCGPPPLQMFPQIMTDNERPGQQSLHLSWGTSLSKVSIILHHVSSITSPPSSSLIKPLIKA